MAKTFPLQTSFTSGVLTPDLTGRSDIGHYYQGMSIGQNVLVKKEGGVVRRWGLRHITDMPGNGRLMPFSFNTEQNYLLWAGAEQVRFVRDDALVTNINGSGNSYLGSPYTVDQCLDLDYTQSADTMMVVHEDVAPQTLIRGTADNLWTLADAELTNLPQVDFNDALSPTPTNHVVDLTFNTFDRGNRYKIELNGFETPEITYMGSASAADQAANERRIKDELLALPPTGLDETGITVAFQAGETYRITFSADSADAYEPMTGRNTDKTAGNISTVNTTGAPRREDVISTIRGWPSAVTFYESRLIMGGLKSLPQSILGTIIGGFLPFNFKIGTGLDDQAIFVTINTDQVNAIRALFPGRHLQVFTSGGEFYCPNRPITPAMNLPPQSKFGCAQGIKPVEVDGATIYATRQRKTLREYLFLWAEEAYNATSLTVLSSHLINDMRSLAAQTSTSSDEQSYVIELNADGKGAVLNTLRAQDIAAWCELFTRTGDYLNQVCVVGDEIYFLVERQRNGATVFTVEKATFDSYLDASKIVTTGLGTTVSGFEHLAGEEVSVIVDGAPVDNQVVSAGGTLTFAEAPTISVEAGYFLPPFVTTMPLIVNVSGQPLLGATKRISDIRIRVKDTLGVVANGQLIPDQVVGGQMLSTPNTPVSGLLTIGDVGWTEGDATITLTQEQPLPFHIQALAAVLEVGKA